MGRLCLLPDLSICVPTGFVATCEQLKCRKAARQLGPVISIASDRSCICALVLFQADLCLVWPDREPVKQLFLNRVGDAVNDDELNRKISPLYHVDKIRAPLIIAQGANDPRYGLAGHTW